MNLDKALELVEFRKDKDSSFRLGQIQNDVNRNNDMIAFNGKACNYVEVQRI